MRLPGVLAALGVLVLVPVASAAADPIGTATPLVHVGPGATESSQRQVVRTRDDVVYIVSVDDGGWGVGPHSALHVYRAKTAGIPTAFALQDATHEPHAEDPLRMSGGDARIDAKGTIHVTYAVVDGSSVAVMHQTFDTSSDAWGPAERITELPADGDGIRGRIVSGLALDPSGAPLVVTASSSGVSAWSRAAGDAWSRVALAGEYGLHPSLAFDRSGRAHLAWLSSPYASPSIRYATRSPEGKWSEPTLVSDQDVLSNKTLDQSPSLAFDGAAHPVVAWLDGQDHVQVAVRDGAGDWTDDGPKDVFSHSPGLYVRGSDRFVFLGHDAAIHPAYLSFDASLAAWSSVLAFGPPTDGGDTYAYDGGASVRFDPLSDPDCDTVDVAFFDEDSDLRGRTGQGLPDLFYAAVTLAKPADGCSATSGEPPASEEPQPPAEEPPPAQEPPPADPVTLLGERGLGPQVDYVPAGMAEAFQSVAESAGTIDSVSIYLDATSSGERLGVGLYADADGHPGALLGQGAAKATADGWNAVAIPDTAVEAGERYWIAVLGLGEGEVRFRDEPGGQCHSETSPSSLELDALPSTWTTGIVWDDCPVSAYGAGA
jgi:hypothetical protein